MKTMQGNYEGHAPYLISPLNAITTALSEDKLLYALGCEIDSNSTDGFDEALDAVSNSDIVVLIMGIDQSQEREGHDRNSITLPGVQMDLIEMILQVFMINIYSVSLLLHLLLC